MVLVDVERADLSWEEGGIQAADEEETEEVYEE